jgi:O-antigen ligase
VATLKNVSFGETARHVIVSPLQRPVWLTALAFSLILLLMQAIMGSGLDLYVLIIFPVGLACAYLLLRHPEITLGLFPVVSGIKAHPSLVSLGVPDLTLVFAGLLALSCLVDMTLKKERFSLPKVFALYIPMALMIPISLSYTIDFAGGLDKAGRFFILSGLAILAPFVAVNTPARFRRFFYVLLVAASVEVISAIFDPQTAERLSSPGGLPLHLGYYAAIAIAVVVYLGLPRSSLIHRLPFYALFPVLFYGLVGSGVRRSLVGVLIIGVLAICFYPQLALDFLLLALGAIIILGLLPIPDFSLDYLSTLVNLSPSILYEGRQHLLNLGLNTAAAHPFFGVGIAAFRFFTPNPAIYDYPHVLLVEIFCELGIFAAVSIMLLQLYTLYKILHNAVFTQPFLKKEMLMAMAFLIIGLVDSSVSGDINNVRPMWLAMSLPFVVSRMKESAD